MGHRLYVVSGIRVRKLYVPSLVSQTLGALQMASPQCLGGMCILSPWQEPGDERVKACHELV
jgi:hypothetical protein